MVPPIPKCPAGGSDTPRDALFHRCRATLRVLPRRNSAIAHHCSCPWPWRPPMISAGWVVTFLLAQADQIWSTRISHFRYCPTVLHELHDMLKNELCYHWVAVSFQWMGLWNAYSISPHIVHQPIWRSNLPTYKCPVIENLEIALSNPIPEFWPLPIFNRPKGISLQPGPEVESLLPLWRASSDGYFEQKSRVQPCASPAPQTLVALPCSSFK